MRTMIWAAACAVAALPVAAQAADLEVAVEGVRPGGTLYVSLQQREQFLSEDQVDIRTIENPAAGAVSVTFAGVDPGDYAVMVWHDDDGNGRFDSEPGGRPLDGWSTVNAESLTAMPTFDDVKTAIPAEGSAVRLGMQYGRPVG